MLMNRAYFFKYMYVRRKKKSLGQRNHKKKVVSLEKVKERKEMNNFSCLSREEIFCITATIILDLCITTSVLSWGAFNYLAIDTTFSHGCMGCFVCILISIKSS